MKKTSYGAHVDVGIDMVSDEACITRAKAVDQMATKTPEYTSDAAYKGCIDGVISAGADLADANADVNEAENTLRKARGARDARRLSFRKANAAAIAQVLRFCTKPADIASHGYVALDPTKGLILPSGIQVSHDANVGRIDIYVEYPKGRRQHRCVVAISPDPVGPGTYVELTGYGRRHSLSGYPPGTYWVRACTLRATKRSEWFGPVAVIVK